VGAFGNSSVAPIEAVTALIESCTTAAEGGEVERTAPHQPFMAVLRPGARHSLAPLELVLAHAIDSASSWS